MPRIVGRARTPRHALVVVIGGTTAEPTGCPMDTSELLGWP
jgi:hypothetical protein